MMWQDLLYPFWRRAPRWLRRQLVWAGSAKFLVGVAALCLNPHGQMLLLERRFHPEIPWGLPGGWVDRGEQPLDAALREVYEETGLEAHDPKLLSVDGDGQRVEIVYLCQVPSGELHLQRSEVVSYRWVLPDAVGITLTASHAQAVACFLAQQEAG